MVGRAGRTARKKATNVSLRTDLLLEARELGISVSQAAEAGLQHAIAQARDRCWLEGFPCHGGDSGTATKSNVGPL